MAKRIVKPVQAVATVHNKARFLAELPLHSWNITITSEVLGMARTTFYDWYHTDIDFKQAVDKFKEYRRESMIENAERILHEHMDRIGQGTDPYLALALLKSTAKSYQQTPNIALTDAEGNAPVINIEFKDAKPKELHNEI
jgi:hypothetical protein